MVNRGKQFSHLLFAIYYLHAFRFGLYSIAGDPYDLPEGGPRGARTGVIAAQVAAK